MDMRAMVRVTSGANKDLRDDPGRPMQPRRGGTSGPMSQFWLLISTAHSRLTWLPVSAALVSVSVNARPRFPGMAD
jgi:hypothetical protein